MSWTITSIDANNEYPVVTSTNITIPAGLQRVWEPAGNYNDGVDGSTRPTVFQNLMTPSRAFCRATINGTAPYPANWRGLQYSIVGTLGGVQVLTSGLVNVPASGNVVQATGLYLVSPDFTTRQVSIPFRHGGDFSWTLWAWRGNTTVGSMNANRTTRLEFVWARAPAPNGPLRPPSAAVRTRVDMTPGYPILLFRLFAPSPRDLPATAAQDVVFYIQRAVRVVWNPSLSRPRYDTRYGAAQYVQTSLGGGFKLQEYFNSAFETCNCYDMAGICQLALSILVDASGAELADSRWVFQQPNGFINPGPLIRWVTAGGDHLRCNTPFWATAGTGPFVAQDAPNRTSFGNHAWVEITLNGATTVVDATHALAATAPVPPNGNLSRQQYLDTTLDQTRPRGNATANTATTPTGNCFLNPFYRLDRIGVYNPWGRFSVSRNMVELVPGPLRDEIAELLEKARNPDTPNPSFVNVDVSGGTHALARARGFTVADETITIAHPASTQVTSTFRHSNGTTAVVAINAFTNFEDSVTALIIHLAGYQAGPLSSIVNPGEPNLGNYSLSTAGSVFWTRGNLFVHVQRFAAPGEGEGTMSPASDIDISNLATALDEDLASAPNLTDPPQGIDYEVEGGSTDLVQNGRDLVVTIPGGEKFASLMSFSDNNDVLVPRGPPDDEGRLLFYPRAPGTAEISIVGAAKGSLRPFETTIGVTVTREEAVAMVEEELPQPPPFVPHLPEE
ncbi:hypothetical protein GQX73_g10692 [Xylaria multiplex]|uniref:Uncharacterized protein n=1 Tax=Xylaria multiplex TaxID=323545 RepID=A0A7C8ISI0_9PEZI|nr:hypothetical protein GQX73_g10692 [Xylaria multiplex]